VCLYSTQPEGKKVVVRNRREANMFREGVGRTSRNYISISLISISRQTRNTDNFQASMSGEGDE